MSDGRQIKDTSSAGTDHGAGAPDDEIKVTSKMIEAGLAAYYASPKEADDEMVVNVYRAMFKAAALSSGSRRLWWLV